MIFVDRIITYPASMCRGLPGRDWCHLVSDESDEELHEFAAKIGCKRAWAQLPPKSSIPHYDLTPSRRAAAVAAGAIEVDRRGLVEAVRLGVLETRRAENRQLDERIVLWEAHRHQRSRRLRMAKKKKVCPFGRVKSGRRKGQCRKHRRRRSR